MSSETIYSFRQRDGEDVIWTTRSPSDAEAFAKKHGYKCFAAEYEFSDDHIAWDFTTTEAADAEDDKPNKYTIVGFYRDNDQPWVEHAEAGNANDAVKAAVFAKADGDESYGADDITIVEAFDGHLQGTLCNEKTYDSAEILANG